MSGKENESMTTQVAATVVGGVGGFGQAVASLKVIFAESTR
jgi:hypothetical protein